MNSIELVKKIGQDIPELMELKKFIDFVMKYQKLDNVMFNVIVIGNEEIHKLNREYRGIDRTTDVLTFALEDDATFVKTDIRILGDIYISIDKAKEQAQEYGHSLLRELCFLTIHGILHLLGYDHMTLSDEKVMFELQERMLDVYGVKRGND